jgi:ADP-heptose:LPS heptosyltransferase
MHMAVAVNTPVVALFGPTDPIKTGPYGNNNSVLHKHTDCQPCFKRICSQEGCMRLISVEEVLQIVTAELKDINA